MRLSINAIIWQHWPFKALQQLSVISYWWEEGLYQLMYGATTGGCHWPVWDPQIRFVIILLKLMLIVFSIHLFTSGGQPKWAWTTGCLLLIWLYRHTCHLSLIPAQYDLYWRINSGRIICAESWKSPELADMFFKVWWIDHTEKGTAEQHIGSDSEGYKCPVQSAFCCVIIIGVLDWQQKIWR